MTDRDHLLRVLDETGWRIKGASGAAARLGHTPPTIRRQMRALGITRPPRPVRERPAPVNTSRPSRPARPAEQHAPVAALLARLEQLRETARLILRTHPPGPARAEALHQLEAQYRALRAAIRATLGDTLPQHDLVRGPCAPGVMRPAWELASTWYW